ncbi:MAG: hypothetical protein DWQ37_04050 [Planctomycetota bacterium]|nr:MAG: hypothetical protein DWQ37_04050 [Planctomycetota bacterium]
MEARELDSSEISLLESVVEEFSKRCGRGEDPSIEEYVAQHPQLEDRLREVLPALRMLRNLSPTGSTRRRMQMAVKIPESIGDYRIVREIGRGGMGVVYHAVQESLNRPVALKVLPGSVVAGDNSQQRFRREASIAAQLHHTNIVPVFGTGSTSELHYYAMQYIEGESLDQVIDSLRELGPHLDASLRVDERRNDEADRFTSAARRLLEGRLAESSEVVSESGASPTAGSTTQVRSASSGTTSRVSGYYACVAQIGIQAAGALAHSHGHGVMHRDIKPSNLILDREGTVWVTDFGLARQGDQAGLTSVGDLVGTLRYLAPERFRGEADSPRSDIYALGLTLYELLAFRPAFEEKDRQKLIRQICEEEPPAPRKQRSGVPRDLETIVLKAIAKEPERRYASAADLQGDLERFLAGRPVTARPLGPTARSWRWCRRNPVVATLASSLLVVLVAGLAVVTWQWRRAEQSLDLAIEMQRKAAENLDEAQRQRDRAEKNFLRARRAVDDYLSTISENKLLDTPTLEPLRAELLARARDFYEQFVEDRHDDPNVRAELAATYIRLSQITHDLEGDWIPFFERGLKIMEELRAEGAEFTDFRSWRDGVYNTRAGWLMTDKPDEVFPLAERGIVVLERLVDEHPEIEGFRNDLAGLYQIRGMVHFLQQRRGQAADDFHRARELREALVAEHPEAEKFRYGLAEAYTMLGLIQLQANALDDALQRITQAKDIFEELSQANPAATRLVDLLAVEHQWLAAVRMQQARPLEALSEFQRTIDLQKRLATEYPRVAKFQTNLALSYRLLGRSLFDAKQVPMARSMFKQCFELLEQRMADYPEEGEYRRALSQAHSEFSSRLLLAGEPDEAQQHADQALELVDTSDPGDRSAAAQAHYRLGRILSSRNKREAATERFAKAIELGSSDPDTLPVSLAWYWYYQARTLEQLERDEHAADAYREALRLRKLGYDDPRNLATNHYRLADVAERLERPKEAETNYRAALDLYRSNGEDDDTSANRTLERLTSLLRRESKDAAARELLAEHRDYRTSNFGVVFGDDWSVEVYPLSGDAVESDDALDAAFEETPLATINVPAIDFRQASDLPISELPAERFALAAETTLELPAGTYTMHLDHSGPARVWVHDEIVLDAAASKKGAGKGEVTSDGSPLRIRIKAIAGERNSLRLRFWLLGS